MPRSIFKLTYGPRVVIHIKIVYGEKLVKPHKLRFLDFFRGLVPKFQFIYVRRKANKSQSSNDPYSVILPRTNFKTILAQPMLLK